MGEDRIGEAFSALERLPGVEERPTQREFARAALAALREGRVAFLEAGPGTGKTFGYLVPLILVLEEGGRAVIATRTRALQEQLWRSDLPAVLRTLGAGLSVALLKGRENYLCLRRLERLRGQLLPGELARELFAWAETTQTGDLEELAGLWASPEGRRLLGEVRDVPLLCSGPACPFYRMCPSRRAREWARAAKLVVVNHALLGADLAAEGRILGDYDYLVVDEAHGLVNAIRRSLTLELTPQVIPRLLGTLASEGLGKEIRGLADEISSQHRLLWEALSPRFPLEPTRCSPGDLAAAAERVDSLSELLDELAGLLGEEAGEDEESELLRAAGQEAARISWVLEVLFHQTSEEYVYWWEGGRDRPALYASPVDLAPHVAAGLWSRLRAAVLTSATLAVRGRVDHLVRELGLSGSDVRFASWPSPFDYAGVGAFVVTDLPEPDDPGYPRAVAELVTDSLIAVPRRALVLFTSRRLLAAVRELLTGVPVLAQGQDGEREALLARFRDQPPPVALLGLDTMWEGVDLPGEELELLFITRLPFPVPTDPLAQAEADRLREQGLDPFVFLFLPQAVLKLRQGVGRLVRTPHDRGAIVITDSRAVSRGYGIHFLSELPVRPRAITGGELVSALKRLFA
jgi:ATP-dependent DNA helicase DinG